MKIEEYSEGLRERAYPFLKEWQDSHPEPNTLTEEVMTKKAIKIMDNLGDLELLGDRQQRLQIEENGLTYLREMIEKLEKQRVGLKPRKDSRRILMINNSITRIKAEIDFNKIVLGHRKADVREIKARIPRSILSAR